MTPPAALPAMLAAAPVRSAPASSPASAPREPGAPSPFEQQLQAARDARPAESSARDTRPQTAKPQPSPSRDNAPAEQAPAADTASKTAAAADTPPAATPPSDAALAELAAALAGKGQPLATAPAPEAPSTETPDASDSEGAAALAGAMLAMLGQVHGVVAKPAATTSGAIGDATSGKAKAAATLPQAVLPEQAVASAATAAGQATTQAAAPAADLAATLGAAAQALPPVAGEARKDHGLEALGLAASTAPTAAASPTATALPQLQLGTPAGQPGFAHELGQQLMWVSQQDVKQARILLNPKELGAIDVQVSLHHDRVDVVFGAQQPGAVTAVQQSLPQLGQMLAQHGLSLGQAQVGQQGQGGEQSRGGTHGGQGQGEPGELGELHGVGTVAASRLGLLDAFA